MTAVAMSEQDLQDAVLDLARMAGWTVAHFRAARTTDGGWRTPVAADGQGFPDLVLAHPHRGVLFVELKSASGRIRPEQDRWLDVLDAAGADVAVWRPRHWTDGTIEHALIGGNA